MIATNTAYYMGTALEQVKSVLNSTIPEIHLSYLIDSSEMLNDIPRFALYIHLLSAVICMGISSITSPRARK